MHEDVVEKKLRDALVQMENRIRSYLDWCKSPLEKLVVLEFLRLPGAEITWCRDRGDSDSIRACSGGFLDSTDGLPILKTDMGACFPAGLVWLESWARRRFFHDQRESKCCRLVPQYDAKDQESGEVIGKVDLAVFWPRADGEGYLKIAVLCDPNGGGGKETSDNPRSTGQHKKLQSNGWIVTRFNAAQISGNPARVVDEIRNAATDRNTQIMKERRTP
jgi:hypothetical protein